MQKSDVLLQMMQENNWVQRDVAELIGCDRSEVSKVIHGHHASWFWESLLKKTKDHELYIAMLEERLEAVNKLQNWIQKEKSPQERASH